MGQKVPTKTEDSPSKRRKVGVTLAQKQALIDNLQLEVTERARKLRAQYNLQAQGLRTRIEIRVNRIPMALRKLKMGDLLLKHSTDQQRPIAPKQTTTMTAAAAAAARTTTRVPPPVPEKDFDAARSVVSHAESTRTAHTTVSRPLKRLSDQLASGDKENQNAHYENPKKRQRGGANLPGASGTQPVQVLSPASSNSRVNPRDRERAAPAPQSPFKSSIARPMSPTKQTSTTNIISSMVEKARASRTANTRKPTTSSTASSAAGGTTATAARTRGRGAAAKTKTATTTATAPATATATTTVATAASRSTTAATARHVRSISGTSESSDGSTSTVVRKAGRPAAGTAASTARKATAGTTAATSTRKTVMSSIKKGVTSATTKRAAVAKTAQSTATTSATTRSGRVLRKRD
ncbi:MAG: hypothetical protein STHCBS139747_006168 [Sporothrix thermara]